MARSFRISGLRSKFEDLRHGRKEATSPAEQDAQINMSVAAQSELSVLIENIVIPKLMADSGNPAHRISENGLADPSDAPSARPISAEDVDKFAALTTSGEARDLVDFATNCLAAGNSVETLYVKLLAPAARKLGEMWEDDTEDFIDVTMGLWRIQEVLRELSLRMPPAASSDHGNRSALFSSMPGEQHSLGTLMIAECFQRAGWDADVLIEPSVSDLTSKAASNSYDLIGLTLSSDCSSHALTDLIQSLRSISSHPDVCIMIGGRFVIANPHIVQECGANATATDAAAAITLADELVPARTIASRPLV